MPAKAKFPVIGWNAQTACMARSRWIASVSQMLRPTTSGAIA